MVGLIEVALRIILTFAAISGLGYLIAKEAMKPRKYDAIHLPKLYLYISIILAVCFICFIGALVLWGGNSAENTATIYLMLFILLLQIIVLVAYLNWKIEIQESKVTYRTFFRRSHTFDISQAWIRYKSDNIIIVKTEKKTFVIDPNAIGIERFVEKIRRNKKPI